MLMSNLLKKYMVEIAKRNSISHIKNKDNHPHLVIMMMKKEKHVVHHVY